MPAITYQDWSGGLDLRLPIGVADANRLQRLQNAYITSGKKIAKRPGLRFVGDSNMVVSAGLKVVNGRLTMFALKGVAFVPPNGVDVVLLDPYPGFGGAVTNLNDVLYAEQFQGNLYVVAQYVGLYDTGGGPRWQYVTRHHYVDGSPSTLITDVNCPHGASVTKAASRIFAVAGEVVRYCAIGAARNWTTPSDAGFLPTSLQQDTRGNCTAVGTFDDALVVFFESGSQVWDVAEDPSANQLRRRLYGVGTQHPQSLVGFYRDLVFASPFGVRSIAVQENVDRLDETDIGVPVDKITQPAQRTHEQSSFDPVRGFWLQPFGQYWLMYDAGGFTRAFVYSFSKSSKLMCWSEYVFPVLLVGVCNIGGRVYARSDFALYEVDPETFTDNGQAIAVDAQMAFQDAKLPGVEKMFYGADFVLQGTAQVSYLFDPRDITKETSPQAMTGDTRAGGMAPVEVQAAAIAPRFRHEADEAFSVDLMTLYYHPLSAQAS